MRFQSTDVKLQWYTVCDTSDTHQTCASQRPVLRYCTTHAEISSH